MTCQECELKLGTGEEASEHLANCADCRWLAEELRLNSIALREMKVRPRLPWVLAAAAAILLVLEFTPRVETMPAPHYAMVAPKFELPPMPKRIKRGVPSEPLRVKMLTSDPDVVIYWIVDRKEGFE